jgi:hypothetical protein
VPQFPVFRPQGVSAETHFHRYVTSIGLERSPVGGYSGVCANSVSTTCRVKGGLLIDFRIRALTARKARLDCAYADKSR